MSLISRILNTNNMKTFAVTLVLIIRYLDEAHGYEPVTKESNFTVQAETESEAIQEAKKLNISKLSIYESYATEL
jgi:hypothetical protein